MTIKKAAIFGLKSTEITKEESSFFSKIKPTGFILFSRNIINKTQTKKLTDDLRNICGEEIFILIDQEGGRVARLNNKIWKEYPSGEYFANLYSQNPTNAKKEIYKNFTDIAKDLQEIGINVNCTPIIDIAFDYSHEIIKNRCFGSNPEQISILAKEVCRAQIDNNIFSVIKHIPGHGRAISDSHLELPVIDISKNELTKTDFMTFKNLSDIKFAMTAHILYPQIDDKLPATLSKKIIEIIREEIGFKNILMTDDLSMKALNGTFTDKVTNSIKAGCDLILHCNGEMEEMIEINNSLNFISDNLLRKLFEND